MNYYSVEEVCSMFHINRRTVYNWIKKEKMSAVKIGKSWYIPCEEVDRIRKEGLS